MRRSSTPDNPANHELLIKDEGVRALREAQNGLRQFDEVLRMIQLSGGRISLSPEMLSRLNFLAVEGIWSDAGEYRTFGVKITGTPHQPPHSDQVPSLVRMMCDFANAIDDAFELSAYLMWRLNWIHPFGDGNGRTSRAISYFALSVKLGMVLPGSLTIPEQIVQERGPYYHALDAADLAWGQRKVDVWEMSSLIQRLLQEQLS